VSAWQKMLAYFGFGPDSDEDYEEEEGLVEEEEGEIDMPPEARPRGSGKVVNFQRQSPVSVVTCVPESFEDVQVVVDHLRSRRAVVLNLEHVDSRQRQRILDFVAGALYAESGHSQKVSEYVFALAPRQIELVGHTQQVDSLISWRVSQE
jgi:cell division inhibitor SepF